ncbi:MULTISPECIES: hypothetical protein [Vibrio]|uniref:Uncharacterized protein n=2 Tax=Vibrio TaxID=662 RepID=A0A7X4LNY5_9VIBR|nr:MULTISPECIES: hypothetical protein [Vibrio]MBF9003098.1 hypothetical protein [Vibrio nitrifigilis]MZI95142.1 hypothetical protein [Vibrio eleionomae]
MTEILHERIEQCVSELKSDIHVLSKYIHTENNLGFFFSADCTGLTKADCAHQFIIDSLMKKGLSEEALAKIPQEIDELTKLFLWEIALDTLDPRCY